MDKREILAHVDHTLLSPCATWEEIKALCEEALAYGTASVCIPPAYVKRAADAFGDALCVCTVIGFPLGYSTTQAKVKEVEQAIAEGAREVDMVVNLGDVKNGDLDLVTKEIAALKRAAGENVLKVIVETCYLTEAEKVALCRCVTEGGADFIKTSTGFGTGGAALSDIALFKANIGPGVRVKASGGVRTREAMEAYLAAGCSRIGTSSAIKALAGDGDEAPNSGY